MCKKPPGALELVFGDDSAVILRYCTAMAYYNNPHDREYDAKYPKLAEAAIESSAIAFAYHIKKAELQKITQQLASLEEALTTARKRLEKVSCQCAIQDHCEEDEYYHAKRKRDIEQRGSAPIDDDREVLRVVDPWGNSE